MKLGNCNMCNLCKSRLHISFPKGKKPANVMIVFSRESNNHLYKGLEDEFVKKLHYELKYDWYKTYVIKCMCKDSIKIDHILKCRKWLMNEIKQVNPYLVILVGKIALTAVLGTEYKEIPQNVFFVHKKRRYFVTESITGDVINLKRNLNKLLLYIKEFYE